MFFKPIRNMLLNPISFTFAVVGLIEQAVAQSALSGNDTPVSSSTGTHTPMSLKDQATMYGAIGLLGVGIIVGFVACYFGTRNAAKKQQQDMAVKKEIAAEFAYLDDGKTAATTAKQSSTPVVTLRELDDDLESDTGSQYRYGSMHHT